MSKLKALLLAATASASLAAVQALAAPASDAPVTVDASMVVKVADGCGPNGWRGPYGHCRNTPYYGPLPGGYYQPRPVSANGCPPGYWRGPWGHCRNTPYHGRLPNGGWK